MSLPRISRCEEWLADRSALQLKEDEEAATLARVSAERRTLPMVEIDKPYRFEGPDGEQGGSHVFVRDGDRVFHTNTTYTGDGDVLNGTHARLDLFPFGREPDRIRDHDRC